MTEVARTQATANWLDVATSIADHLCASAFRHDGECTWMGTIQQGGVDGPATFTYETLGPDLYGGASGIALFLVECYARTGNAVHGDTARDALHFSAARTHRIPHRFRHGFYAGRTGVAFALARAAALLDDAQLASQARGELDQLARDEQEVVVLDVISGVAGAIAPLLMLANTLSLPSLREHAQRLGEHILRDAIRSDAGWCWGDEATGFHSQAPLTGYGHGASGLGVALLELFAVTDDERFRDGAREAFRYERSLFSALNDNWPDLRYSSDASDRGHYGVAWCLGAAGIGLARARALQIDPGHDDLRTDLAAALRAVDRRIRSTAIERDFSLCHGGGGLGDIALAIAAMTGAPAASEIANEIAGRGAAVAGRAPTSWGCGIRRGSNPSLMLGLAGIGHFYLRLADPTLPSVLIPLGPGNLEPSPL